MAERKPKSSEPTRLTPRVVERRGVLGIAHPTYRYRVLLDDGRVLDVESVRDDSDVRGVLLTHSGAERIAGVSRGEHVGWTIEVDDDAT